MTRLAAGLALLGALALGALAAPFVANALGHDPFAPDLMARFEELHALGLPLMVGTSRKRFIGSLTGRDGDERDVGTAATSAILRLKGAAIFRVHNVAFSKDALVFADAMMARSNDRGADR